MPAGRPPKFTTPDRLWELVHEYIESTKPHIIEVMTKVKKSDGKHYWQTDEDMSQQRPITITGFCVLAEVDRKTILNYEKDKPEFFPPIAYLKMVCEGYAEEQLMSGRNGAGAQFTLRNNYGWEDKQIVENHEVKDDLDDIDDQSDQRKKSAEEAKKALEPVPPQPTIEIANEQGSTPPQ